MRITFGFLTKLGIAAFLLIIILNIWFDISLAWAAIPIFIEWVIIPLFHKIAETFSNAPYRNYGDIYSYRKPCSYGSTALHWDPKTGSMIEDMKE